MTNQEFKQKIINLNEELSIVEKIFSANLGDIENLENDLLNLQKLLMSYEGISLEKESKVYRKKILDQINRLYKYNDDNIKKRRIFKKIGIFIFNVINDLFLDEEFKISFLNDNKKIILFVASKPIDVGFIRFNQEYQKICDIIEKQDNCQYKIFTQLALKKEDLQNLLEKYKPNILHFSGHGDVKGLVMETRNERTTYADSIYFDNLLQSYSLEGIYFNACYSGKIIDKINKDYFNYGIGNNDVLNDFLAIDFAENFYLNLIEQNSLSQNAYQTAFKNCKSNITKDEYINRIINIVGSMDSIDVVRYDLNLCLENMKFFNNSSDI